MMKKIQNSCTEEIDKTKFSSPIGPIKIETCVHGLHAFCFISTDVKVDLVLKFSDWMVGA